MKEKLPWLHVPPMQAGLKIFFVKSNQCVEFVVVI